MEEAEYKDWYSNFINENKNDIKFINDKFSELDSTFKSFLQKIHGEELTKNYICLRYHFIFENIFSVDFTKICENRKYYLNFVINFLTVLVKQDKWNWKSYLSESRLLLISFISFAECYYLFFLKENKIRENWYDDYYFLVPKDLNLVVEISKDLNIKDLLSFKISEFYKSQSLEHKESILYILTKDVIDDDLGKNYEGTFFTKEELQNIWRKKIHAIRHGKSGLNKNKDNEWWQKYNNEFKENQKNDFLEELLLFIIVFLIDKTNRQYPKL